MESSMTLSETMSQLSQQGYVTDFNNLLSVIYVEPEAFVIEAIYRFEGPTDPGDELILYALSSDRHSMKGVLLNAYGVYAESVTANLEQQLHLPLGGLDRRISS
ncbi:phosphoribosylpyrophosphate synthetase [Fibrella aquatilis]|uniref:Phosphoribosylpyrophosphate synthetase n=1 Tax=Fibrella aquatilis TaxID=2817059 RepID=A0A939G3S5_9BACT|nr:phosphoribosylpyrophosphate synthetase [Fibrella aquatilis]MBO0931827.1 phosphoribosylpyrophosphate synthetase [Fibrella aquatilis]